MALLESKISNTPGNDRFEVYFLHLESRKEHMEDYMRVGESKAQDS